MVHEVVVISVIRCWLLKRTSVEGNSRILCSTQCIPVSVTLVSRPGRGTDLAQEIFPRVNASKYIEEDDTEDEFAGCLETSSYDPLQIAEFSNFLHREDVTSTCLDHILTRRVSQTEDVAETTIL